LRKKPVFNRRRHRHHVTPVARRPLDDIVHVLLQKSIADAIPLLRVNGLQPDPL
jgi:hypothetical protein